MKKLCGCLFLAGLLCVMSGCCGRLTSWLHSDSTSVPCNDCVGDYGGEYYGEVPLGWGLEPGSNAQPEG